VTGPVSVAKVDDRDIVRIVTLGVHTAFAVAGDRFS
jgi:hypothetical protein